MCANCKFYVFCKYITFHGVGCFIIKFIVTHFANTDRLLTKQTQDTGTALQMTTGIFLFLC
jgi:hypothetical protein